MIDSSAQSHVVLNSSKVEKLDKDASSGVAEQLVLLFDEVRVPLLRYLSAFPLSLHDSEDLIQEAFLSLFQQLQCGKSVPSPRGWLFRAVHHLALKKRVRSKKDLEGTGSLAGAEAFVADPALSPEDQLAHDRKQKCLQAVVRALPEQNRWCLYLRSEGLRYREIGEILNMSLGAVSNCLQRSLAMMARAVER